VLADASKEKLDKYKTHGRVVYPNIESRSWQNRIRIGSGFWTVFEPVLGQKRAVRTIRQNGPFFRILNSLNFSQTHKIQQTLSFQCIMKSNMLNLMLSE
jgi:hypothetical protein